eukprot:g636.t1
MPAGVATKQVTFFVEPGKTLGETGKSYSQRGQDWIVAALLGCKRDGYFIDLAANDAIKLSNTLALEHHFGWSGLCIEANPRYLPGLTHRKCDIVRAAVGAPTGTKASFVFRGILGGLVGDGMDNKAKTKKGAKSQGRTSLNAESEEEMSLVSLAALLQTVGASREIDYMSLDVEGAESMVMAGFQWDQYRFKVLTVERPKKDLVAALTQHGYVLLRRNAHFNDQTWVDQTIMDEAMKRSWATNAWDELPKTTCTDEAGFPKPEKKKGWKDWSDKNAD